MIDTKWARIFGITFAISTLTVAGCHRGVQAAAQDPNQSQYQDSGPDPADQNMAPVDGTAAQQAPINESQQQAIQYGNGSAPVVRQAPGGYNPNAQSYPQSQPYDQTYDPNADQGPDPNLPVLEADQAPPALLEYDQPEAPGPDYIWTPGYWSWSPAGYFWVPGVWCAAPYQGALWTPGYWYFTSGRYRFHYGYWGLYIGFYGGINYGYGYFGTGYHGGYWNGPHFYYNTSITRVNVSRVTYIYRRPPPAYAQSRVSFNGGRGGIEVRPRPAEIAAMRTTRTPPMTAQIQVRREAEQNRQQFYNQNRGRPEMTVAPRPVAADRGISRPAPIQTAGPRPGFQTGSQSGQRPDYRQGQDQRPGSQPQSGFRPGQSNVQPNGQPNNQAPNNRPQNEVRPVPQTPVQNQPRPQSDIRPYPGQTPAQNQPRPQPEVRPTPQPPAQSQPHPQQQLRPQSQFNSQPGSQPQVSQPQVQTPAKPSPQTYPQRDFHPGQNPGQDGQPHPPQSQLRHEGEGQPQQPHLQPQGQPQQQFRPQPQQQQPQQSRPPEANQFHPQAQPQTQAAPAQPHPQTPAPQPHSQGPPPNNDHHDNDHHN